MNLVTWAFFAANAGRIFSYLPQILAAIHCRNGAVAVSRMTWGYFAVAHLTGVLYGLVVIHDHNMALVFLGNFIACCVLVGIVTWKKIRHARQRGLQVVVGNHFETEGNSLLANGAEIVPNALSRMVAGSSPTPVKFLKTKQSN